MSIMPSMPMFTTPLRSEMRPPSAPQSSGVANRSIAAISADHVTTSSRWPVPDRVAGAAALGVPGPRRRPRAPADRADDARRDRAPAAAAVAAPDRVAARRHPGQAEDHRRHRAADEDRRQRDEPREQAERDAGPGGVPRCEARALALGRGDGGGHVSEAL